ncbi:protein mono-ADP-ribosyltransferase PARP16 [Bradysia coprophila]|uniref:protein mono-ADP-ribosyltransferase PARP16 n=1 Tax=Bradysia coprophila TaxID=38358 RepID=UPI00187DC7DE|nr:protein mono-ADP-ribosyltransferase PARP16 [Bradysia coprophila]
MTEQLHVPITREDSKNPQNQIVNLKLALEKDIAACDIKWSLFVAAAQSYRHDSRLNPYPPKYATKNKSEYDIERIRLTISNVPPLLQVLRLLESEETGLNDDVIDLVHWVVCSKSFPTLRSVAKNEFDATLKKVEFITPVSVPTHIFEVVPQADSAAEGKFQQHAENRRKLFAFHGSKVDSFYSIVNFGLQQHLCKTALFGDGIYLSSEMHVSLSFSPIGSGWKSSLCGNELSCIALCEFVDHPQHLKCHIKDRQPNDGENERKNNQDVPDKYFVITNNDIVRVRYLLMFAKLPDKPIQIHQNALMNWIYNNKSIATMIFYAIILLSVGLANSRTGQYFRQIFWQKVEKFISSVKTKYFSL